MIDQALARLGEIKPETAQDIRLAGQSMIRFSPEIWTQLKVIREFLFHRMYRAPDVVEMRVQVTKAVDGLFPLFMGQPDLLPKQWRKEVAEVVDETALARIVLDYIAGMTDRFALQEYERLCR